MSLNSGERQVAPTLDGIRADHRARYEWAAKTLKPGSMVIDVGCGIGYGARILANAGHFVTAIDRDQETIDYARRNYAHEHISYYAGELAAFDLVPADAAVCFEMIEHVADPLPMLRALREKVGTLLASVPNEDVMPYRGPGHEGGYAFHHRHYTRGQFEDLLIDAGFMACQWLGQAGPESPVEPGVNGRTLVAVAIADEIAVSALPAAAPAPRAQSIGHVAILGMGPSVRQFMEVARGMGGASAYCDEVWAINALGDVFTCDRVFHMDDVRIQEIRAAARPDSNIANMLHWLKVHPGPVITSRAHPDYRGLVEFPLAEVLNEHPMGYFNSTAAYAVALAIHEGATKISCFGMDFTYPNAHDAEKGRACVEFWLGVAAARGIQIAMPKTTSLMDALYPQAQRFYGYDTQDLQIERGAAGAIEVKRTERATLPTADEIEAAYDHTKHPNPLVQDGKN